MRKLEAIEEFSTRYLSSSLSLNKVNKFFTLTPPQCLINYLKFHLIFLEFIQV